MAGQDSDPDARDSARTVGGLLARLRRERGLTGVDLGRRVRMSQAKISKVENDVGSVKVDDVLRIARALDASPETIERLLELVEESTGRAPRWQTVGPALDRAQPDISTWEAGAAEVRAFGAAVPPGLLHIEPYARAVLSDYARPLDVGGEARAVPAAVTARVRRQEILADRGKTFLFVLAETALLNRVARPAVMLGQVDRLREAAAEPNVEMRILRSDTQLVYAPLHDFQLLDDSAVIVDTMTTTVVSREAADLTVYRRVFEYFWEQATADLAPVLDSYGRLYADLARPAPGSPAEPPTGADLVAPPEARAAVDPGRGSGPRR